MPLVVLITGAAGNLAHFIHQALVRSGLDLRVIACNYDFNAVGLFRADAGYVVPPAQDLCYVPVIVDLCRREGVQIIMAGNSLEMRVLAEYRDRIREQSGACVVASPATVLRKMEDKWEQVRHLERAGFDFPRSVLPDDPSAVEGFLDQIRFPCIVKDRLGSGSRGLGIAENKRQLDILIRTIPNPMLQEYLHPDHQEHSVGVFVCSDGKAAASIVMKRQLHLGMTFKAQVLPGSPLGSYSERVAEQFGCLGPCNVQLRLTERGPVVFEVNPRFSSTTSARPHFGYNDAEMCIRHFVLGEKIHRPAISGGRLFRIIEDVFIEEAAYQQVERTGRIERCGF